MSVQSTGAGLTGSSLRYSWLEKALLRLDLYIQVLPEKYIHVCIHIHIHKHA